MLKHEKRLSTLKKPKTLLPKAHLLLGHRGHAITYVKNIYFAPKKFFCFKINKFSQSVIFKAAIFIFEKIRAAICACSQLNSPRIRTWGHGLL